jgi:aspartyl aminopeptidase
MCDTDTRGASARFAVEKYGGMILYTWLDKPLSVAGRVVLSTDSGIETRLVNIDKDIAVIPSIAIHFNRSVNDGYKFNPAVDMLPLTAITKDGDTLLDTVSAELGVTKDAIISHDLFLYNRQTPSVIGLSDELILSPRLDDLECVYASLESYLATDAHNGAVDVLAVFDNEEVGSETKQGAASTFLADTLRKIAGSDANYSAMLASSFMVSADNAHAIHPNHPELSDPIGAPTLGGGIAVKYNANQRYTTDAVSDAIFRTVAKRGGARTQSYYHRADLLSGSTLGSIADTRVSISTVDIGLPQLAMHSATECAAVSDLEDMILALTELYSTSFTFDGGMVTITK